MIPSTRQRGVLPPSCPRHFGSPPGTCPMCALERAPLAARSPRAEASPLVQIAKQIAATTGTRREHIEAAAERARAMRALDAAAADCEARMTITAPEAAQEEATMGQGRIAALIAFRGISKSATQWGEQLALTSKTVRNRVEAGIPLDAPTHPGKNSLTGTWDYAHDREVKPKAKPKPAAAPARESDPTMPPSGIAGVVSHARRGRWLELELADGRLVAFDPIDVVGCQTLEAEDGVDGASLTVYLRGRESEFITPVDARALWALITAATR